MEIISVVQLSEKLDRLTNIQAWSTEELVIGGLAALAGLLAVALARCRRQVKIIIGGDAEMRKVLGQQHELNRLKSERDKRNTKVLSERVDDLFDKLYDEKLFTGEECSDWRKKIGNCAGLPSLIPRRIPVVASKLEQAILKGTLRLRKQHRETQGVADNVFPLLPDRHEKEAPNLKRNKLAAFKK